MAIVIHEQNEKMLRLTVPGTQAVADHLDVCVIPFDGVIRGILARLDTAGTTGTQTTDILLNGVSIFSGATLVNFASTSRVPTYGALTTNPPKVKKGDTVRLNTTAVHSGTAGKSLAIDITIRRGRASQEGTDFDSVSARSDAI